jgi:ABC-type Fe3+/spermidine/putrescine transport system ATPase subunit
MSSSEPFVRLVNLTKRYQHGVVVDAVSLDITRGEFMVLLGGSGSGKTTLLRLIAGLEIPEKGQVWIDGELVADDGNTLVASYKRKIGFVFQDLALWPHLTLAESIAFVLNASDIPKQTRKDCIREILQVARIERFGDRYPHQLSGGEQQRAAIARAIAAKPRLLLMDEPMSSLDIDLKQELRDELANLQSQLGLTTIYVTHDRAEIVSVAHRVALMRHGKLEAVSRVEPSTQSDAERRSTEHTSPTHL